MIPAWLPVKDTASTPSSARAMHKQRHRHPLARGQEHVELARRLHGAHVARQPEQVVGGLAHGAHHDHHVGALAPGPGHVVGHGAHPLGVTHRRPAVFLHHQGHTSKLPGVRTLHLRTGRPPSGGRAMSRQRRPVGCRAVPTDKRARKRSAREAKLAALERQRRRRARTRRVITLAWSSPRSSSASTSC